MPVRTVITADEIILGSASGARLPLTPDGIDFRYGQRPPCAQLTMEKGQAHLRLYDLNGQARVKLWMKPHGAPMFCLTDGNGEPRLHCEVVNNGRTYVELIDGEGIR